MGNASIITPAGGSGSLTSTAAIQNYDETEAVSAGAVRLYQGYQVSANGNITGGTPFSWGTTGATWAPDQFGASFKGVYDVGTTYAANDIVAADTTSTAMHKSKLAGNVGQLLSNPTYWEAASFTVASTTAVPILAYQVGETYYVGQHICYNGLIVTPNGTVTAGTPFAWGTTGATFKLDLDTTSAYFAVNTEYVSPDQHGNIYGKVYRMYFGSSLPAYLTTGTPASKMVDAMLHFLRVSVSARYSLPAWSDAGTGVEYIRIVHNGASGAGSFTVNSNGCTLISGWVDYTK